MNSNKIIRWKILLFPHWFIKLILVMVSAVLLVYSLGYEKVNTIIAYGSYALSAYTLTVVVIKAPAMIKAIKRLLHSNKYSDRYLSDRVLRARISLYVGSTINIFYAMFHLGTGIFYRSAWTIAIAVYYMVLSVTRYGLVRRDRRRLRIQDKLVRRKYELRSSHFCGCLLFLLNIAVSGLVVQMIWQNKHYDYPGFLIYAQAAFAFYSLTMAIINVIKYRKMERPILSAAKVVSMSSVLTSILALQTAMLMQFGSDEPNFIRLMNSLTGTAVCLCVFVMAVGLVHITRKELKQIKKEERTVGA